MDICDAFNEVLGYRSPKITIPYAPMMAAGWLFEQLDTLGLIKGIGRERIRKLALSTNIVPAALIEEGYAFETDLKEGLKRWKESLRDPA